MGFPNCDIHSRQGDLQHAVSLITEALNAVFTEIQAYVLARCFKNTLCNASHFHQVTCKMEHRICIYSLYGAFNPQGFVFPFHFMIWLTSVFHATFRIDELWPTHLVLPPVEYQKWHYFGICNS
jgi:hypothetical protein